MRLFDTLVGATPVRYSLSEGAAAPTATKLGLWERVTHLMDQKFHAALALQNAQVLGSALRGMRRLTPLSAQSNAVIALARSFERQPVLRKLLTIQQASPEVQQLADEVKELGQRTLAMRLGLLPEEMATAPGLEQLAKKDRIYNYMARYNESCSFIDGEVFIKHNDRSVRWSEVPENLKPRCRGALAI